MCLLLCLAEPTAGMRREAAAAGLWNDAPKLQILTVEQLLAGERPRLPMADRHTGSKPARSRHATDNRASGCDAGRSEGVTGQARFAAATFLAYATL